jgi:hypothetical protein
MEKTGRSSPRKRFPSPDAVDLASPPPRWLISTAGYFEKSNSPSKQRAVDEGNQVSTLGPPDHGWCALRLTVWYREVRQRIHPLRKCSALPLPGEVPESLIGVASIGR